jgi:hypothetical protein
MSAKDDRKQQPGGQQGDKQPAGNQQQQRQGGEGQQYGEGNYKATRQYNEGLKEHVQNHDIEREARDAAPRTDAEKREMEEAERIGRSKSRGEGASPDGETGSER